MSAVNGLPNGDDYAPAVNGLTNGDTEDKWYMKDTSHDVTASAIVAREN